MAAHGPDRATDVVMTSSIGIFGPEKAAHYATAKGAVFGLYEGQR